MRLAGGIRPRVCLVPTAMGDWPQIIDGWYASAPSFGPAELSHLQLFPQPNVPGVRAHATTFSWGAATRQFLDAQQRIPARGTAAAPDVAAPT